MVSTQAGLGTGAARTLLTLTDIAADASYPVRDYAVSQTGVDHTTPVVRIPLVGDKLIVQAYNANTTTNTATVYVILSPVP